MYIAGRTADGLDKGAVAAQEALLVGIEDGDEDVLVDVKCVV